MTGTRARAGRAGWIFGSFAERDAALALLDDEGPAEPRDELGIGPLRDVFANAFFPGVTTPQTRAKYFLFVPAMYKRIEGDDRLRRRAETAIKDVELELLKKLMGKGQLEGVIGQKFRRVPTTPASAIYWAGVRRWGIRLFSNSRAHYHGWLQTPARLLQLDVIDEDATEERLRWLPLPNEPTILDDPDIRLTRKEAAFLETRVHGLRTGTRRPLLRELLDETVASAPFWDLTAIERGSVDLAPEAQDAARVAEAHHGAMLLYNFLCARQAQSDSAERWHDSLLQWRGNHPAEVWRHWDVAAAWQRVRNLPDGPMAHDRVGHFVQGWIDILLRDEPLNRRDAVRAIVEREAVVKPGRTRLSYPHAMTGWTPEGVGAQRLDYRWARASRIVRDIQEGLAR